ncbi:hypothetical protein SRABI128_03298 [Microbacterium sp. Bi128]|nr:hypothetical protein SRABI128_03298 [Microbacterium sp. Bi128]
MRNTGFCTTPSSSITSSYSAPPRACAAPPSICPRHCAGLITTPASAVWIDCSTFTVPVSGSTATRTACTLNASERKSPNSAPSAVRPCSSRSEAGAASTIRSHETSSSPARTPDATTSAEAASAPVSSAAMSIMRRRSTVHAACSALPATVVPAEAKAPVSWRTASVSAAQSSRRSGEASSTVAAICRCTVEVPLPNSAVPTRSRYVPSGRRVAVVWAMCPRGAIVAIIAAAMPSPTAQPAGASTPLPRRRASCARLRHWSRP